MQNTVFISYSSFQLLLNNHLEKYYKFLTMLFGNSSYNYTGKLQSQISEVTFPINSFFSHQNTLKSPIENGPTPFQILRPFVKSNKTKHTQSAMLYENVRKEICTVLLVTSMSVSFTLYPTFICNILNIKFENTYPKGQIIWYPRSSPYQNKMLQLQLQRKKNENLSALKCKLEQNVFQLQILRTSILDV